ncbi:MAG: YtxH domain-containing protein [Haliscomenobacter sp.]|nr:YtxH domain-containing protein [Haliscomenobacter sp.]MBK9489432.1 YtxH domain-containing protein [Haliscomenobacter sp.]
MSTKNLLALFVAGAATGAALGILFAPTSGEETRKKILKAKNQSVDYMDELIKEGKQSWFKTKNKLESDAGIAANEVDDFISHILKRGAAWWSNTKNKASALANEAENTLEEVSEDGKKIGKQAVKEGRSAVNDLQNHFS